jgi:hypothetical protein
MRERMRFYPKMFKKILENGGFFTCISQEMDGNIFLYTVHYALP